MAVTDAYATQDQYKAVVGAISPGRSQAIEDDLFAISREIDDYLHRFFTRDDGTVERVYWPQESGSCLYIDDVATLTDLVIKFDTDRDGSFADETALTSTQFEMWPKNADKGPEPQPWDQIVIPALSTFGYRFSPAVPVSVTAHFGWPAVPRLIRRACIDLTRIRRFELPEGQNITEKSVWDSISSYGKAVFA